MTYPLIPESWTEPVNQNLYAAVVFLICQGLLLGVWRFLRWAWRTSPNSQVVAALGWTGLALPPIAILTIITFRATSSPWLLALLLASLTPLGVAATRSYSALRRKADDARSLLNRLRTAGIRDAIVNPDIATYGRFLCAANSSFAFLGVGAEKLTREFEVFQAMVSRCGTPADPVRLLLVSPDAEWLKAGAARRGLGKSSFLDRQVLSLQRISRVRFEFSGHVAVRFYSTRPVLRLMFANHMVCWLGHYTESAAATGMNEFAEQSNSSVVLERPDDRAPDRQLYGALETFFEELWNQAEGSEWDFKTYLQ